ncbi:hypothetical protein [Kordiimonas sediminis]|uniref:hypothetical protein n=1 Tax=Kordiimonas sediminis TaxID=1735581 RepID=UPI00174AC691|nr:hypothetical protein [Kordiimonas sediminis]
MAFSLSTPFAFADDDIGAFDGIGAIMRDMQSSQNTRVSLAKPKDIGSLSSTPLMPDSCEDPRMQHVERRMLELAPLLDAAADGASLNTAIESIYRLRAREIEIERSLMKRYSEIEELSKAASEARIKLQIDLAKLNAIRSSAENGVLSQDTRTALLEGLIALESLTTGQDAAPQAEPSPDASPERNQE